MLQYFKTIVDYNTCTEVFIDWVGIFAIVLFIPTESHIVFMAKTSTLETLDLFLMETVQSGMICHATFHASFGTFGLCWLHMMAGMVDWKLSTKPNKQ